VKILAGIDFTPVSDVVVEKAADYALLMNAKLWLVHVAAPNPDFVGFDVGPKVIRNHRAQELREEHRKLQAYADACEKKGVNCIPLLVQGSTIETLIDVLNKLNVDLLVIGSHKHSSLYDFVVGSVRNELFHTAEIPILMVPEVRQ
jgi:nucleotide-binding universal stress UspA family protein